MSVLSSVVRDLVELVGDQIKEDLRVYAYEVMDDVDAFANGIIKRAVNAIVTSIIWATMICGGVIFALVGVVTFLSPMIGAAVAWALVGVLMVGLGAAKLRLFRKTEPPPTRRALRLRGGE